MIGFEITVDKFAGSELHISLIRLFNMNTEQVCGRGHFSRNLLAAQRIGFIASSSDRHKFATIKCDPQQHISASIDLEILQH